MSADSRDFVRRDRRVALPLAVALVLGAPLRGSVQDPATERPQPSAVQLDAEALAAVERVLTPPASEEEVDPQAMAKAIVALGAPAIPVVVSLLAGEVEASAVLPGTLDQPVHPRALEARSEVLRAALAGLPRGAVLAHVGQRLGAEPGLDLSLMLAGILGDIPDDRAFELLLQISEGIEPIHLMRSYVQSSLEPALANHLVREPRLLADLDRRAFRVDAAALALFARAVGRTHSARAVEVLAGWVGRDPASDAIVLTQLGRVAGDGGLAASASALGIVRRNAASSDQQVQRAALVALGRLRDPEAFEILVGLLETGSSLASSSARWSLTRICDVDVGASAQPWREWRERETTWWEAQAPTHIEALHSEEPGVVMQAVAELLRHPLQRDQVAEALGPLLGHSDERIARAAAAAIARLDSARAVPWLLEALSRPDPELRRLAASGLGRLTGLVLPPDPLLWSKVLAS